MRLVYERPKAFMRGCIDVSGSAIGIHHDQPIPDGPVLYVHHRLRPADLLLLAGHLEEPAGFIAGESFPDAVSRKLAAADGCHL